MGRMSRTRSEFPTVLLTAAPAIYPTQPLPTTRGGDNLLTSQ